MTESTSTREVGTRRQPVSVDRLICWRLGPVVLDRCRECVHLLRLESLSARDPSVAFVVCADHDPEPEVDFAW